MRNHNLSHRLLVFDITYTVQQVMVVSSPGTVIMRPGQLREETPDVSSGGTTSTAVLPRRAVVLDLGPYDTPCVSFHTPDTAAYSTLYSYTLCDNCRSLSGLTIKKQLSQVMG